MAGRDGRVLRRPRPPARPGLLAADRGLPPRGPARRHHPHPRQHDHRLTHSHLPGPVMTSFSTISDRLGELAIEVPSWAYGNSGTRFRVFGTPGTPRTVEEKIA